MSHDLGRPSLFAGMEDGSVMEPGTQRVRILSTLESSRGIKRPTRMREARTSRLGWIWWTLLGLGGVILLTSFVLIVKDQHRAPRQPTPQQLALQAGGTAKLAASSAQASEQAAAPLAASAPAIALTKEAPASAPGRDPLAALNAAPPAAGPASAAALAASVTGAPREHAARPAKAKSTKATQPAKAASAAKAAAKPRPKDNEVELIEAVMTHANSRPGSPR